jgi:hypothetical protein
MSGERIGIELDSLWTDTKKWKLDSVLPCQDGDCANRARGMPAMSFSIVMDR